MHSRLIHNRRPIKATIMTLILTKLNALYRLTLLVPECTAIWLNIIDRFYNPCALKHTEHAHYIGVAFDTYIAGGGGGGESIMRQDKTTASWMAMALLQANRGDTRP